MKKKHIFFSLTLLLFLTTSDYYSQSNKNCKLSKKEKYLIKEGFPNQLINDLKLLECIDFSSSNRNNVKGMSFLIPFKNYAYVQRYYMDYYRGKGFLIFMNEQEIIKDIAYYEILVLKTNNIMDLFHYYNSTNRMTSEQLLLLNEFMERHGEYIDVYSVQNNEYFTFDFLSSIPDYAIDDFSINIYMLSDNMKDKLDKDTHINMIKEEFINTKFFILYWSVKP